MARTTVGDLKAHLSAWLDRVRAGEDVLATDRGRPVARLVPCPAATPRTSALAAALCGAGPMRPGSGTLPEDFWSWPRPSVPERAATDAVREDRDGR